LIGEIAAQKLGVQEGQQVSLDGRPVPISGVFRSGSRLFDGGFMVDLAQAQRMLTREGAERHYSLAVLRTSAGEAAGALIAEINREYPSLRAIRSTEFAGALRLLRVVNAFVTTISVVALVGTCVVVSNTFLMAIAERTREIGILMAVGWTPWLVLRMLMAESLVLCVVGAALGNGFALILLQVINRMESIGFGWIPVTYPPALVGTSFALALSVAFIALAWPAIVLWRVQPLSALRHE
jgi:putative ABC transport system permease protein